MQSGQQIVVTLQPAQQTLVVSLAAIEAELSRAAKFCLSRYPSARVATCRPIGRDDVEEVTLFHELYLPLLSSEIEHRLNGTSTYVNYDWSLSLVLRHERDLMAILLAYPDDVANTAFVYGLAVHHTSRRSWPSILMRSYAARHLMMRGYEFASYLPLDENRDATRLAERASRTMRQRNAESL